MVVRLMNSELTTLRRPYGVVEGASAAHPSEVIAQRFASAVRLPTDLSKKGTSTSIGELDYCSAREVLRNTELRSSRLLVSINRCLGPEGLANTQPSQSVALLLPGVSYVTGRDFFLQSAIHTAPQGVCSLPQQGVSVTLLCVHAHQRW